MKHFTRRVIPLLLAFMLLTSASITVSATGSGNIDGGGGGMGQGTVTDVWYGQDGVRVTIVTTDGAVVSTPFNFSNFNIAKTC